MSIKRGELTRRIAVSISGMIAAVGAPFLLLSARGRERWFERWGFWSWKTNASAYIWLHGASAGEVVGLSSLVPGLKRAFQEELLLTTTSVTGLRVMGDEVREQHLLTLDRAGCIKRALVQRKIRAFICAETEIWPTLYSWLAEQEIPVIIVNGRISDRSFPRYQRIKPLLEDILRRVSFVAAGDPISVDRFISLGVKPDRVQFLGNSKYSKQPSVQTEEQRQDLRKILDISESLPTVVLGSLRPGEEQVLFPAIIDDKYTGKVQFIIAPRHAERYDYFADKLKELGVDFRRFSSKDAGRGAGRHPSVLLLDSFGWLEKCYSLADLVFIGGSLEPHGGHNPLEACAYGAPVVMGPHFSNVEHVVEDLRGKNGISIISSSSEFKELLSRLLSRSPELAEVGRNGAGFFREHAAAADRILARIREFLERSL